MKELYNTPEAELIVFSAKECLANSAIPYNDEQDGPPTGGSQWIEDV